MEISAQHELFMEAFLDTASVYDAAEKAGFARHSGPAIFRKLRERIVPLMEDRVTMMQMKAINVMEDSMGSGAEKVKQELRIRAAQDVMDRGGITKKQTLDVQGSALPSVMILPAKDPIPDSAPPISD